MSKLVPWDLQLGDWSPQQSPWRSWSHLILPLLLIPSFLDSRLSPSQLCSTPFVLLDFLKGYLGSHIFHKEPHT